MRRDMLPTAVNHMLLCRYDIKEKRYVLMWATAYISTTAPEPSVAYPLFVAVSATSNPLGKYTVWALDTVPNIAPGLHFCRGGSKFKYAAEKPKVRQRG